MKKDRSVYIVLVVLIAMLVAVSGWFFSRNINYKSVNRKLILQNDSLMGVIIEMNRDIDKGKEGNLSAADEAPPTNVNN